MEKESGISISRVKTRLQKIMKLNIFLCRSHTNTVVVAVAVADIEIVVSDPTVGLLIQFLLQ